MKNDALTGLLAGKKWGGFLLGCGAAASSPLCLIHLIVSKKNERYQILKIHIRE
jgi:hypothetical protein